MIFSVFLPTFFLNFRFRALPLCQTGPCSTNGSTPIPSQASLSAGSTSGPTLETAGAELRCCGAELRCSNINTQKKMHFPRPRFCLDGSQVHPSIHLCSLLGANERLAPKSVNGSLGEGSKCWKLEMFLHGAPVPRRADAGLRCYLPYIYAHF